MSGYSKDRLAGVVIAPHVSEKAARIANEGNQYVFRVRRDATKPEIRAAVEYMFEVKVDAVHVVNQAGKRSGSAARPAAARTGRRPTCAWSRGSRSNWAAASAPEARLREGIATWQ